MNWTEHELRLARQGLDEVVVVMKEALAALGAGSRTEAQDLLVTAILRHGASSKEPVLVVHEHVDLDAVACVVAADVDPREVEFAPANAAPASRNARVLDHPAGDKGRLDEQGRRHAAVCSMPETADWPRRLLDEIDEADSTGQVLEPRFSLQEIVAGLRTYLGRTHSGRSLDRAIIRAMQPILLGLVEIGQAAAKAERLAADVPTRLLRIDGTDVRVARVPSDAPPGLGKVLNEQYDVSCSIYAASEPGRYDIGVTRYPGRAEPDLTRLAEHLPGWFVHSAGFLACWGSRKAPARRPPPKGTPATAEELLGLLREVYER